MPSFANMPTTAWTMVKAVRDPDNPDYCAAMNRLISRYWAPVYYFLRMKRYAVQEAEDLTQAFFLRCFERNWLAGADPERGRFRNLLLKMLVRFASDQGPRAPRQQQFEQGVVSVSALMRETDRQFEPSDHVTPEDVFMQQWAKAMIHSVQQQLRWWCEQRGRLDWYELFMVHHFPPPGERRPSQQALATRWNVTRDQIRYGLEQSNQAFVELLRAEVADQVRTPDEIDIEIQELQQWLEAGPPSGGTRPSPF